MAKQNEHQEALVIGRRSLRVVDPKDLNVDHSYQRPLVPKHKKIAAEYDADAFGVPLVGQRDDGTLWIVDGQQRIAAKKILGHKTVRVDVFASKGPEHEARVFKLVNMNRTKLSSLELFHAMLAAGDETCHAVKEIVEGFGCRIPKGGYQTAKSNYEAKRFSCAMTLCRIYDTHGADCLRFVLRAITKSWPADGVATRTELVGGLMLYWSNNNGIVNEERLFPRLASTTPTKILYSAGLGIGLREQNVAQMIEKVSRKRKVSPLVGEQPDVEKDGN